MDVVILCSVQMRYISTLEFVMYLFINTFHRQQNLNSIEHYFYTCSNHLFINDICHVSIHVYIVILHHCYRDREHTYHVQCILLI